MKKLQSIITMGCLVSSLLLSPVYSAFASDEVNTEAADSQKTETPIEGAEASLEGTESAAKEAEASTEGTESSVKEADKADSQEGQQEQIMCYSDGDTTQDPQSLEAYLSEDPTKPQEAIMLTSETGAVIDGYHLNHDQVKVLNINTGNITINADTYTQQNGETNAPWDAKSDAYVIRGRGNSANNITIASPQTKITIYLMDLEWNGTIVYTQATEVEFVICGEAVSHSNFITSASNKTLTIKGLTAEGNSIRADGYLFNSCTLNKVLIENVKISADVLSYTGTAATMDIINSELNFKTLASYIYCHKLLIDHSKVTNIQIEHSVTAEGPCAVIQNNSEVKNLYFNEDTNLLANTVEISDSIVDNIQNYYIYGGVLNIYKVTAKNSVFYVRTSPITNLEADKCTIEMVQKLAFKNIIANSCSIKGAFIGTPVDYESHDLFLKTLRLREHPNEYVYVSIDGGEKVKFLTDLNGCVYPYIKAGSKSATVTTEDGTNFSTTFDPVTGDDENVTILTPGGSSGGSGGGEGGGTVNEDKPVITDTTLKDLYLNLKDPFTLSITARSKTSPSNLSYQWYKDGKPIELPKAKKRIYSINIAREEHVGVYCCYVTDNNNNQVSVSKEIYVTVDVPADPKAPVIMGQSSSMDLVAGSSVTLSVNARPSNTISNLKFQWYKGTEALEGKTSRTLDLTNVKATDAGSYYCLITDNLVEKETKSSPTVITVK